MLCEGFGKHLDPGKNYEQSLLRIQQCHENHPSSHSSLGPASFARQVWRGVSALGDGLPSNIGERHAGRSMWSSELYWYSRHGNADSHFFLKSKFSWWNGIELPSAISASIYLSIYKYIFGSFFLPSRSMAGKELGNAVGLYHNRSPSLPWLPETAEPAKNLRGSCELAAPGGRSAIGIGGLDQPLDRGIQWLDLLFDLAGYPPVNQT